MKLLAAIDRLPQAAACSLIEQIKDDCDIIELGTSFTKEFGVAFVQHVRVLYPQITLFADIKTMDEAAYEFDLYYTAGADILSVMGSADIETIRIAQQCAKKHKKNYLIDLLGAHRTMIEKLQEFQDAIFCIHLPSDQQGDVMELVKELIDQLPQPAVKAAAGGIQHHHLSKLHEAGIQIVIIGSAITKAKDPQYTMKQLKKGFEDHDGSNT